MNTVIADRPPTGVSASSVMRIIPLTADHILLHRTKQNPTHYSPCAATWTIHDYVIRVCGKIASFLAQR